MEALGDLFIKAKLTWKVTLFSSTHGLTSVSSHDDSDISQDLLRDKSEWPTGAGIDQHRLAMYMLMNLSLLGCLDAAHFDTLWASHVCWT